jgi:type I restriction enzyme, S subunit
MSSRSSASQANAPKGTQTVTSRRTPVVPAKAGTSKAEGSFSAQRLLKLYDRVADAPDAVDRLRKFVLDLAVRGKLVEQDPVDEPASALLETITEEKLRLQRAKAIRKPKTVAPLDPDELPYAIPTGWEWSQIAQIGLISPRNEADDDVPASFVPMPKIAAELGVPHEHEVRPWGEIKKGYTHFAEGDVGLAKITPCFENGKSTVFRNLTGGIGTGTTELHIVRPIFVIADYVLLFLKSPQFIETGIPRMTGTAGQKRVPSDYFTSSPFPLPPLAEQKRIVTKVNDLMALLDRLETTRTQRETTRNRLTTASLTRLTSPETTEADFPTHARFALDNLDQLTSRPEQIKVLRKAILNLAVRGKLVDQDPADEPASELLARAQNAMADLVSAGEVAKMKAIAPTSKKHHLFDAPFGWCWVRLGQISKLITKGSSPKWQGVQYVDEPHGVLFVTSENVGVYNLTKMDAPKYVEARFNTIESRSILMRGDLLLNLVGASIGRAAEYTLDVVANINQAVALIRPIEVDKYFINRFILHYLNSPTGVEEILGFRVTAAQPNISLTDTRNLLIPLPPLAEQLRIVEKVDTLMALCNRLEGALENTETPRAYLLENLLNKALSGDTRNIAETPEAHIASR